MYRTTKPISRKDLLIDTLHSMAEYLKKSENYDDPEYVLMQEAFHEIDDELRHIIQEEEFRNEYLSEQLTIIHRGDEEDSYS